MVNLGIMFQREYPPEDLFAFCKAVEASGLDELWLVEDCFYAGGFAQTTLALASTEKLKIGLGIMPAVSRNPAFSALEIASLARMFPQRMIAGIGHGVRAWMEQIGALPKSQLAAIEETTLAIKGILSGKKYDLDGSYIKMHDIELYHPVEHIPPLYLGVRNQKSLQLSGRVADGSILAEGCSPAYIQWARQEIAKGQTSQSDHAITIYVYWAMDEDAQIAEKLVRARLARNMAGVEKDIYQEVLGIQEDVKALVLAGGYDNLRDSMPETWMREMAVYGTEEQCAQTIEKLAVAGAGSIVLVPLMDKDIALKTYIPRLLNHLGR